MRAAACCALAFGIDCPIVEGPSRVGFLVHHKVGEIFMRIHLALVVMILLAV
jgi:hypothetical protein